MKNRIIRWMASIVFAIGIGGCASTVKLDHSALGQNDVVGVLPSCPHSVGYSQAVVSSVVLGTQMREHPKSPIGDADIAHFARSAENALGRRVKIIRKNDIVLAADGSKDLKAIGGKAGVDHIIVLGAETALLTQQTQIFYLFGRMLRASDSTTLWHDSVSVDSFSVLTPTSPLTREKVESWVRSKVPEAIERLAGKLRPKP